MEPYVVKVRDGYCKYEECSTGEQEDEMSAETLKRSRCYSKIMKISVRHVEIRSGHQA